MPIPAPERLVARVLIWRWCRRNPHSTTAAILAEQQRELEALIARAGDAATTPVQIKRLPGLEASSTNYSLAMVADHLARVNNAIARTLTSLKAGQPGDLSADPALYKPPPDADPQAALARLRDANQAAEAAIALPDHSAGLTHPHPWFGDLPASTWACFPAFHGQIHAKQARLIARGLEQRA